MAQESEPRPEPSALHSEISGIGPRRYSKGHAGGAGQRQPAHRVEMDTPGGLDTSMRDIIRAILASTCRWPRMWRLPARGPRVPAPTFFMRATSPRWRPRRMSARRRRWRSAARPAARRASRSPMTTRTSRRRREGRQGRADKKPPKPTKPTSAARKSAADTAMERKVVNDAVAYIRGLAELRGRNADWAEQAVRGAASLSATQARCNRTSSTSSRAICRICSTQIDGREIKIGQRTVKLATRGLTVEHIEPDWRTQLLSVHHQSDDRLRPAADRHLRPAARRLQPRRRAAGRRRRDLAAARAVRVPDSVGQLRGARAHRARHRDDHRGVLRREFRRARASAA